MYSREQEQEEIRRSAVEAERRSQVINVNLVNLKRYANPPADTPFPLEYSFHLLHDSLRSMPNASVLDYGCGVGEDLVPIAKAGVDVIGLDISPELIELARKRAEAYGVKARFIVGSAYDTGLPSQSIDIVFAMAIFHHLELAEAKRELLRVLRPGGVLILQEPVRDSKWMAHLRSFFPVSEEVSAFESPLTRGQLDSFSEGFHCDAVRRFRLPFVAVAERVSRRPNRSVYTWDSRMLHSFRRLSHFASVEVRRLSYRVH